MASTAIWTAVHYRVPVLIIVGNNASFFNDELHQERVARERGRPVERRWIGQRIDRPATMHLPLYRRLLGEAWDSLPEQLRAQEMELIREAQ